MDQFCIVYFYHNAHRYVEVSPHITDPENNYNLPIFLKLKVIAPLISIALTNN